MPDLIRIVDLEVLAHIGVPEAERAQAQRLLVSLEMTIDSFAHAASTDNIAWTVNYADIVKHVQQLAGKKARKLLETLSEEMAADLFKAFPIRTVAIEIKKFVIPAAQYVSVKIERSREREWRP
jgi:7,8-dihydroneopterin aldolase/epimerase/oxygenase